MTVEISLSAEVQNGALTNFSETKEETVDELKRKLEEYENIK